jgi:hypothetical protein
VLFSCLVLEKVLSDNRTLVVAVCFGFGEKVYFVACCVVGLLADLAWSAGMWPFVG